MFACFAQRALIRPFSFFAKSLPLPGKANPITRREILYYSNPKNRGYLALQQQQQQHQKPRGGEPTGDEVIASEVESREVKTGQAEAEELGRGEVEGTQEPSREVHA